MDPKLAKISFFPARREQHDDDDDVDGMLASIADRTWRRTAAKETQSLTCYTPENIKQTKSHVYLPHFNIIPSTPCTFSWYFLPSYSRLIFSYPNIYNFKTFFLYFLVLSFARTITRLVFLYRTRKNKNGEKRIHRNVSSNHRAFALRSRISVTILQLRLKAEGRNTCLIISSVEFFSVFNIFHLWFFLHFE